MVQSGFVLLFFVSPVYQVLAQDMTKGMTEGMTKQQYGKLIFDNRCAPCHADGPARPGTQALKLKYREANIPAVLEDRSDLMPAFIKTVVRNGSYSMAPFRKTEVSDAELDAVAAYLSKIPTD